MQTIDIDLDLDLDLDLSVEDVCEQSSAMHPVFIVPKQQQTPSGRAKTLFPECFQGWETAWRHDYRARD